MSVIAAIRPDAWNLPLFLHILGAMITVGALTLAATYLVPAWRNGSLESLRFGYRTLLYAALPSFVLMRVTAQWLYSEEGIDELAEDPGWIGIGFITSDLGALLLIVATGITALEVRRAAGEGDARGGRVGTILVGLLPALYVVAIWAMTIKPD